MAGARTYFGYGSNLIVEQMTRRCPTAQFVGPARLRDHKFRINLQGVATVVRSPGSLVHGILWRLTPSDEAALDRYEGTAFGLYRRVFLPVESRRGPPSIPALVYVALDPMPGRPRPEYLEEIVDAARRLGFPPAYIEELTLCARPSGGRRNDPPGLEPR